MNKLKTILFAACSLVLVTMIGTTVKADSSNFAGPYIGLTASGYGIAMSGTSTSAADDTEGSTDEVQLGKVAAVVGGEIGYALPLGSAFLLDVGAAFYSGETMIRHDGGKDGDVQRRVAFKVDDLVTIYIAPTIVLSDTSSLYVKVGLSEADTGVTGDVTSPGNLSGTTWAMGTRTVLESGIFIKTEAGYTEYNAISVHGTGTSISTVNSYSAEPTVAFGTVTLGFRF